MIEFERKERYGFEDLLQIMKILRAPDGCMWDREQDHHSIRRNFIEETYEAVEASDNEDSELLKEELGDVLLQVVFHAEIESEKNVFDIGDVTDGICKKLIFRHPHIFSETQVSSTGEILENWEHLKQAEKHQRTAADTLDSVARSLPALIRADKVLTKAAKAGFDWESVDDALGKVREELQELEEAVHQGNNAAEELGDLLLAAAGVARFIGCDPEQSTVQSCEKFISRFRQVETLSEGRPLGELTLDELTALWQQAKKSARLP